MSGTPFLRLLPAHGAIRADGTEFPELLHRLSASDVRGLADGRAVQALLTTDKGRILDNALVLPHPAGGPSSLLLCSPHRTADLLAWFDRYTIMEDVRYADESAGWLQAEAGGGEGGPAALAAVLAGSAVECWQPAFASFGAAVTVLILPHDAVTGPAVRVLAGVPVSQAEPAPSTAGVAVADLLTAHVEALGMRSITEEEYDAWRVRQGYPAPGRELGLHANPLEAGAGAAVSFTKGCYIGQEVIARLDTYGKVQRRLVRLHVEGGTETDAVAHAVHQAALEGAPRALLSEGRDAGYITSLVRDPASGTWIGLGCVRHAMAVPGTRLALNGWEGWIVVGTTVDTRAETEG